MLSRHEQHSCLWACSLNLRNRNFEVFESSANDDNRLSPSEGEGLCSSKSNASSTTIDHDVLPSDSHIWPINGYGRLDIRNDLFSQLVITEPIHLEVKGGLSALRSSIRDLDF